MTPPKLSKTHATLLTIEETTRAAAGIKLLGASMGFTKYTTLHARLAANGYPGSYATFARLLNAVRPAQEAEITAIARFFNVQPRDLTGADVNPVKDPTPPRLIEYDLPAPEVPEGPAPLPLPVGRKPKPAKADIAADVQALADSITELTTAIREFAATSAGKRTQLREAS